MPKQKLFLTNKKMPDGKMEEKVFPGFYITNPHLPFYFFSPLVLLMVLIAILYLKMTYLQMFIGAGVAIVFWPFFEYTMHRYLFHWEPSSKFWKKLIYTIHEGHHDYPNDGRFMLVGPIVSVPAFILFLGLAYLIAGNYAFPFMAGIATCYMFYDWLHYATHHYNFKNKIFQSLKRHHMRHHYEDNEKNFAFTVLLWDTIFRTTIKD